MAKFGTRLLSRSMSPEHDISVMIITIVDYISYTVFHSIGTRFVL